MVKFILIKSFVKWEVEMFWILVEDFISKDQHKLDKLFSYVLSYTI